MLMWVKWQLQATNVAPRSLFPEVTRVIFVSTAPVLSFEQAEAIHACHTPLTEAWFGMYRFQAVFGLQ